MGQYTLGLDTYQLSSSYDASTSGTIPASTNSTAYTMAGEASTNVTLSYRNILQNIFSLSQSTETSPAAKAKNAVILLQLMNQLRQSALTGLDYVNTLNMQPTDPFIMSQNMVQTMDVLAIQMAHSGLTPAKMIAWANSAGLTSIVPIPTDYIGIQNALNIIRINLPSSSSPLPIGSASSTKPDASFGLWQDGIVAADNKTLLLTQIQSTYPALSTPLDNGEGTGGATQILYDTIDIDPGVVSTYNQVIAGLNAISDKTRTTPPTELTKEDVNHVIQSMKLLRKLANGTQVLDPHTGAYRIARLTSEMVRSLDTLSRGLSAVGLNTSANATELPATAPATGVDPAIAAIAALQAWTAPSSTDGQQSIAQISIASAQSAGAITGSEQAMVELQYVTAGIDMLEKQLTGLNQALSAVQTTAQLLGTLQQIHNYIDVNAPVPLALQAYNYLKNDTTKAEYVGLVQKAIFNQMSSYERTTIAKEFGIDPASFGPNDITPALFNGIPLQTDGTGLLTTTVASYFADYKNAYNLATTTFNNTPNSTIGSPTTGPPSDAQILFSKVLEAKATLIYKLSLLAYVTFPKANADALSANNPPVVPPSQINALRQLINPYLNYPIDAVFADPPIARPADSDTSTLSPPLAQDYIYTLNAPAETAAPTAVYKYSKTNPPLGSTDVIVLREKLYAINDPVTLGMGSLKITATALFDPVLGAVPTSSGQSDLPNPALLGLIGNLQWNDLNTDLGATLNNSVNSSDVTSAIASINTIFGNYRTAVAYSPNTAIPNLKNELSNLLSTLSTQGKITTDQQIALQSVINQYLSIQTLGIDPSTLAIPQSIQDQLTFMRQSVDIYFNYLRDNAGFTTSDPANATLDAAKALKTGADAAIANFKNIYISASMGAVTPTYTTAVANLHAKLQELKDSVALTIGTSDTAPWGAYDSYEDNAGIPYNQRLSTYINNLNAASGNKFGTDILTIGNTLQVFLLRDFASTPTGIGIKGLFAERMNITPAGDPQYISPDTLTLLGVSTTPDFNLQSAVVTAYNKLSNEQRKAFVLTLTPPATYTNLIALLKGATTNYPNYVAPTSATIANGSYIPIPAQLFKTYYVTQYPTGNGPLLSVAALSDPNNVSAANYDALAKKIYGMTIPPFVKIPAGQTIDDVLAKILNTRAQLAQQLAGLTLAEQQQQTANGSTASVTPIVKYVTAVLKDLESIPDPTASTYNAVDARTALNSWILDGLQLNANSPDAAIQTAASNSGTIQTNLQTAITAATNMNGTQQQKFQQYMTVYSEFMQSASAVLTALMQIIRAMITGMK